MARYQNDGVTLFPITVVFLKACTAGNFACHSQYSYYAGDDHRSNVACFQILLFAYILLFCLNMLCFFSKQILFKLTPQRTEYKHLLFDAAWIVLSEKKIPRVGEAKRFAGFSQYRSTNVDQIVVVFDLLLSNQRAQICKFLLYLAPLCRMIFPIFIITNFRGLG